MATPCAATRSPVAPNSTNFWIGCFMNCSSRRAAPSSSTCGWEMVSSGTSRMAGVKRPLYSKPARTRRSSVGAIEVLQHRAGDQHALPGAQRQREVAGERAQQFAEQPDGLDAVRVAAVGGARGDLGGGQLRDVLAVGFAQRLVDVGEAGAGQHALGRHAAIFLAQPAQQLDGTFVGGREARMPAFGGEHGEARRRLATTPPTPRPVPTPTMAQTPCGHAAATGAARRWD